MKPLSSEHPEYYGRYIALVKEDKITEAIAATAKEALALIRNTDPSRGDFAYAEDKWTLKEVLIHCIDTERIFSTRALCFARGDQQKALSFDENIYAPNSEAHARTLESIASEFECVSGATLELFKSFSEKTLALKGETPSGPSTVAAIGFAICGHTLHHLNIIRGRYLK
ncbi:MAG: DinB family protein [Bacteroidota bacterium]